MRQQLAAGKAAADDAETKLHGEWAGGSKAAVATAHNLLVIVWFVLHDHAGYRDLGADYFTRHDNPDATKRRLIRELQALGYAVDLTPAA